MKPNKLLWNILFSNQKSGASVAGFSLLGDGKGVPPPAKNLFIPPNLEKTPLLIAYSPSPATNNFHVITQ